MKSCERCGSIRIVRVEAESVVAKMLSAARRRQFKCERCGWSAHRDWSDADLETMASYAASGVAEIDPDLTNLDSHRKRKRKRTKEHTAPESFKLSGIPTEPEADEPLADYGRQRARTGGRKRLRVRRRHSVRSEILAAIAISFFVIFVVAILGLTGSCGGGGDL